MEKEVILMFKRVTIFDLIIACISVIILYIASIRYLDEFLLGLLLSNINFLFSGIVLSNVLSSSRSVFKGLNGILFVVRIFFISFVGYLVYKSNTYNILSYMSGFCSHFLSLIAYSISAKDN